MNLELSLSKRFNQPSHTLPISHHLYFRMLTNKSQGRLALHLRDSSEMVIDEYHKMATPRDSGPSLKLSTPSNATDQARLLNQREKTDKLPALKSGYNKSQRSARMRRSTLSKDEEMKSADRRDSCQRRSVTDSHSANKRRRVMNVSHLQMGNHK